MIEATSQQGTGIALRHYQQTAFDRVFEEFDRGMDSTLVVLPTGCVSGETVIGLNRAGKGYSRPIAQAYRLRNDPRTDPSIPTRIRAFLGDRIGLHGIREIVYSGIKDTCELSLANGRSIRTTPDHEILTDSGWMPMESLHGRLAVACQSSGMTPRFRKPKAQYAMVQGLLYHPFAMNVESRVRADRNPEGRLYRVSLHRLVVEAGLNRLPVREMVAICRDDPARSAALTFLDPGVYAVHHKDRDHRNNDPDNLEILTHEEHWREHGRAGNWANFGLGLIEWSAVSSVRNHGPEPTYDVVCDDPHRNFVGNGIVVHNCGKTVMFGAIARRVVEEIGGRVLILAHRGELLTQASNTLAAIGLESSIEKADQHARACFWEEPRCVIASVQTMQRKRLLSWPSRHFKLVIVDEAHHVLAESYRKIIDHLAPDWHLGVTATADRLDGSNLGRAYRSVAHEYSLRDAIREGFLAKLRIVRCETSVDLANIKTTGGDLNQGDLEDAIRPHIEELANAIRQEVGDRRTIVFTPDVGSAQAMASALNSLGLRAESISGDSPDRDQIIDGFRKGRFRILVNCALLTEGFDAPFVSAIVLARPTKSRALFAQMAGRGTRLSPGKKECLLIDFAWMTGKHKLITPVDLFDDGGTDPGVKASAKKSLDDGETDDLMEAIERAEETKRERERLRVLARHRPAVYRRISYNPFEAMTEVLGVPVKPESDAALKSRPTDKQLATLAKFGVTNADAMSKRRASMMLDVLIGRAKAGLATMKQVGWATSLGLDPEVARSMTMKEMGAWLDENSKRRA